MKEFRASRLDIRQYPAIYHLSTLVANRMPGRLVYPPEYFKILRLLESQDQGNSVQGALRSRLCRVLCHALQTVPYYKELRLGIDPRDLTPDNCEQALQAFPLLEKQDVSAQPQAFISSRYIYARLLKGTTGGSTGEGLKVFSTYRLTLAMWAFYHYQWSKIGFRRGCRVARLGADACKPLDQDPFTYSYDKLFISPAHLNERWFDVIVDAIGAHGTEFIHSYPSCLEEVADFSARQGRTVPSVQGIFLASERVFERQLDLLARVFPNATVQFGYGLSERTNLAWGERTTAGIRYRIEPVYGFTESYRHEDGRTEIVGTSYWNEVMPLVRYKTCDFGAIKGNVIEHMDGREGEFVLTRQGSKFSSTAFSIDHFVWDYVHRMVLVQNEPGKIEVNIKPRPVYNALVGERILKAYREQWNDWFAFSLILTNDLPRTARGKQDWIINNVARKQAVRG